MKLSERMNKVHQRYAAGFLSACIHPDRLAIINMLFETEGMFVWQIQEKLNLDQSLTSFNLKVLHQFGVLNRERKGKSVMYSINASTIEKIIKISDELYTDE